MKDLFDDEGERMAKKCAHDGCTKQRNYGVAGTKNAEFCSGHAKDGMVDVYKRKCSHDGCTKLSKYGAAGTQTAEFCSAHAKDGMIDVKTKRCAHRDCTKHPSYGVAGTRTAEFCSAHAKDGMIDVVKKRCIHDGCTLHPSYGVAGGTKAAEFCFAHATDGMINVVGKRCIHNGCSKHPSYGIAGSKAAKFCFAHAKSGMVNVVGKRCIHNGCSKHPSFGVAGTKTVEFCARHVKEGMVDVVTKRCIHRGCTTIPSLGFRGGIRTSCVLHAEEGMLRLSNLKNLFGVHGSGRTSRGCGRAAVDGGSTHGASAIEKREQRASSSIQDSASDGKSRMDNKRKRQAPAYTPGPLARIETEEADDSHTHLDEEDGSFPPQSNTASIKIEVAVASNAGLTRDFPVEAVAGAWVTPAEDGSGGTVPDFAVKTKVDISLLP